MVTGDVLGPDALPKVSRVIFERTNRTRMSGTLLSCDPGRRIDAILDRVYRLFDQRFIMKSIYTTGKHMGSHGFLVSCLYDENKSSLI